MTFNYSFEWRWCCSFNENLLEGVVGSGVKRSIWRFFLGLSFVSVESLVIQKLAKCGFNMIRITNGRSIIDTLLE